MHWAAAYVGKPYAPCARGPEAYDCWGLVWEIERRLGLELPWFPVSASVAQCVRAIAGDRANWEQVGEPAEGDVVGLSYSDVLHHVGVWIAGGCLHALEGAGVCHDDRSGLLRNGWRRIEFYRRRAA